MRRALLVTAVLSAVVLPQAHCRPARAGPWYLDDAEIRFHVIAAAPNGQPLWPHIEPVGDDFKARINEHDTIDPITYQLDYLNPLVQHIRDSRQRKILIFVHGGMNLPGGALRRSAVLGARGDLNAEYYPIFINWNSGPLSTYGEHLFLVRQGQRQPLLGAVTSPFYLLSDVSRALIRAPAVWLKLLQEQFDPYERRRATFSQESWRYLKAHKLNPGEFSGVPDLTLTDLQEADQRSQIQLTTNELHNVSLILKAPAEIILDAIGTGAWEMMLRRSRQLFDSPTRFAGQKSRDQERIHTVIDLARAQPRGDARSAEMQRQIDEQLQELYRENRLAAPPTNVRRKKNADYLVRSTPGAVELFLNALEQQLPAGDGYSITLIGHSMGAIVANEILLRHPKKLPIDNIVYLAAACSVKECEDALVPYLRQTQGHGASAQFYNLSLHPVAEITETFMSPEKKRPSPLDYSKSTIGLFVPRGSLLQWLDAFFTTPLNLEDRRLGKWATAISSAGIFPGDVSDRIHLTMFPVGLSDLPQKHGQFDSLAFPTRFWQQKFWLPNAPPETKELHEERTSSGAPAATIVAP